MVAVQCRKTLVHADGVRVAEFEMAPHAEGDAHLHSAMSEYCICLQGRLQVWTDGDLVDLLAAGDRVEIPTGVEHQLVNDGHGPCRYLVVQLGGDYDFVARSGPD